MTNPNTYAPVVKTSNPTLYENHTFHMQKARKYTYNYVAKNKYNMERAELMRTRKVLVTWLDDVDNKLKAHG